MPSLERMYFDIQRDYAASIIRNHFSKAKNLSDFYNILKNKHLNPFLKEILAPEVFQKKPLALPPASPVKTVTVDPKRSTAMIRYRPIKDRPYTVGRYTAIKTNVIEILKERCLTTNTLVRLLRIRHGDMHASYIHSMLSSLANNNIVYRIPNSTPIIWALSNK